ncbi:MAG: MFS transporter [Armatimonas sp.]
MSLEKSTLRKVNLRLIPFIALLYTLNILDRTNIAVASLTMKPDLHFSDSIYGLGAGMFFIGYFFFEVPSNLILEKFGARLWIARIMVTWGIISACMMFVKSAPMFYTLRFLLGVAEAGFYPGIILYLTYWFPTAQRAQAVARFVAVSAIVGVIGGPIGGQLLKLNGVMGLTGWQWLFLVEGIPSCILGIVVLFYMTDRPEKAHWLTNEERGWLMKRLAGEAKMRHEKHSLDLKKALMNRDLLQYCGLFFLYVTSDYGIGFFAPQIFKAQTTIDGVRTWSDQQIAFVASLPALVGAIAMLLGAAHSDRNCERKYHVAFGAAVGVVGIILTAISHNPIFTLLSLMLFKIGHSSCQGPFWSMPTSMLTGAAAAGGIAFINSVGNLGGFAGPFAMGKLKDATGGYQTGLFCLAGALFGACLLGLASRHSPAHEMAMREAKHEDTPVEMNV